MRHPPYVSRVLLRRGGTDLAALLAQELGPAQVAAEPADIDPARGNTWLGLSGWCRVLGRLGGLRLLSRSRVLLGVLSGYGRLALLRELASERRDGELVGLWLGFLLAVAHDNEGTNAANNNNSKDRQKDPLC